MTAILRIVNTQIVDSTDITVTFTEDLTPNLIPTNVAIISQTGNVPNSQVLLVTVNGANLYITCQPLTPYAAYFLQFFNLSNSPFISVNGDAQIMQNGVANQVLITGPLPSDNPVMSFLQNFYANNIYNVADPTSVVSQFMQAISVNFSQALYDIRQLKNENYLSFTIIDEQHTRGPGPYDRLYEEGTYEVMRVGYGPSNALMPATFIFTDFPDYPVTLQRQIVTEIITTSSNNNNGTFNINTLTFNLGNNPVTKVDSITFTLLTPTPVYVYNLESLGYQLLNSEYDQDYASSYALLANNQVKLNEVILQDPLFSLDQIFNINIQYEYKGLGIQLDTSTVNVFTTLQSVREVLPPITNVFNLQHAPITDASNNTVDLGGVIFTDPNSNNGSPHPAFIMEIGFSLSALPLSPGIYSIDYPTGTVYVYGATTLNDGTGPSPPLATYYYQFTYTPEIDYIYDTDLLNVIALPLGNLINSTGTITFNYEQVLIPGTDYNADTHIEVINEQVGNNLIALNALNTQNMPITNVFQVFNESSGEIYLINRWYNNTVYFNYNVPPRISQEVGENVTFFTVTNELLGINTTSTNINSLRVFTIYLANNTIINSTQDAIGASFNTSLMFVNGNVFVNEIWYNQEVTSTLNINRLNTVGEYTVDYINGIVYLAVSNTQQADIGTASYKMDNIVPDFANIVSIDNIYYRISVLNPINKQFSYVSFTGNSIVPANLDVSDESFLNGIETSPYQVLNGMVGAFIEAIFVPGVTNAIKFLRSIFEYNDLFNSTNPLNFATVSTSNNFNINLNSITGQTFENVQFNGNYFITLGLNIPYISPGISYVFNVIRASDSQVLWNSSGSIVPGNPLQLILPGIGSPQVGDLVTVTYSFTIIPLQRVIVDYNKGDFFVDYTYVADNVLVSYEYGDNVLDFRQNMTLPAGTTYYVSYKAGALRDALLANFGTLINVPDLATFDLSLDRERYREALQAALSSFIMGPTIVAIKNLVQIITHAEPQVIESAFQVWSLGSNLLNPVSIQTTSDFQLTPAHFGNGVLVNQIGQTITLPVNDNLRLEEGTFEGWILPQWHGLDNDAILTFSITQDGQPIQPSQVFIGHSEYHPTIAINNTFSLDKSLITTGYPNTNKDGIFIYYTNDPSKTYQRWYVKVIDGYVSLDNHTFQIQINSSGKFYDVRSISVIQPANLTTTTGNSKVSLTITPLYDGYGIDGYGFNGGISFVSDLEHYFMDFGLQSDANRLSIFKDVSGYLNFRVFDKNKTLYAVSANVSSWYPNDPHMIAASWKLNTRNNRDEMHLFIDGLEVPNIVKYGQALPPFSGENYRTINPDEIVGLATRDIVGSDDLVTTINSNVVTSSINFSQFNIYVGDPIFINEPGFLTTGYTILAMNGQTLYLNSNMPSSITNGRYSVNQTSYVVTAEINVVPNITVSTTSVFVASTDLITIEGLDQVSSATNFQALGVLPGFLLRIDNSNFALTYVVASVTSNTLTLSVTMPVSLNALTFQVYSTNSTELPGINALNPNYSISQDANYDNILTIYNGVYENDLVLINLLGLNFQNVSSRYYVWSDGYENVLMTQLPPPISLNQAEIIKILIPILTIGQANATLIGGNFVSNFLTSTQPTNTITGRTIQAVISGTNINFTNPVQVFISGTTGITPITESIYFTNYGALNFANSYTSISYIQVTATPINATKNVLAIEISETYSIIHQEFDGYYPVIRYSYPIDLGYTLYADGSDNMVSDSHNLFSYLDVGNYLVIQYPPNVAGYYTITDLSTDRHSIFIQATSGYPSVPLPAFTNGTYQVLNTTAYRSGLQNGFFTLEYFNQPGHPWLLNHGTYQVSYATYLGIKFASLNTQIYFGTDFSGNNVANSILNQFTLSSIMMSDTRIGEVISNNVESITKDYNSIKPSSPTPNTLLLISFDSFPFTNSASFYASTNDDHIHFQSDFTVNDNFEQSIVILDKPIVISNAGILDNKKQGTIEFWVSPIYDTGNDPNIRYYFDAYSAVVETVTSVNNVSVKIGAPASQILKVSLASGDPNVDYFVRGKLEIDTAPASMQEADTSVGTGYVIVSQFILQVITVKIVGDLTGKDYFANGVIGLDGKTIYLGIPLPLPNLPLIVTYQSTNENNTHINTQVIRLNKRLPAQNTQVTVTYIPAGLQGDRISLYKDIWGGVNFQIIASNTIFLISAPTRWEQKTWHRIKASYMFNGGVGNDQMVLYLDGYCFQDILYGTSPESMVYGVFPGVYGGIRVGQDDGYSLVSSITFKDPINTLYIGSTFEETCPIYSLLDNFRISNIYRQTVNFYGEAIDVNWSSNLGAVFAVSSDLYTTLLLDFNTMIELIPYFAQLVDRSTGSFDFKVNVFDPEGLVANSDQVKTILESLIQLLTPANAQGQIVFVPQ
jgi:hypothetical protein